MNNLISLFSSKLKKKFKSILATRKTENIFPFLGPNLPLPEGLTEQKLFDYLKSVLVSDAPPQEMINYCTHDFRRFVYTYGLGKGISGRALELGANPYFTTFLIKEFTSLELTLANYFGSTIADSNIKQKVFYQDLQSGKSKETCLGSYHFNVEEEKFPFPDQEFDVILFCEIIEHLLMDPVAVLKEIKRVMKPNGVLILTTPNVSRLENVAKMISGVNIYDPYSGYGAYGRHNREYNKHELYLLLEYLGFEIDTIFTADVHANASENYTSISKLQPLIESRKDDLGQYIFVKAINKKPAKTKKPLFLYRSYAPEDLE